MKTKRIEMSARHLYYLVHGDYDKALPEIKEFEPSILHKIYFYVKNLVDLLR